MEVILQNRSRGKYLIPLPIKVFIIFTIGMLSPYIAYPATLIPLKVKCEQGQKNVRLPIDLKTEPLERVSGIQFDIVIPPGTKITNMSVAESAQKANKMVSFNQIKNQTYRTIVAGLNQQTIPEGTILFVNVSIEDTTLSGKQIIKLLNTVLADPEGKSIPCTVIPGEILFPGEKLSLNTQDSSTSAQNLNGKSTLFNTRNIGIIITLSITTIFIAGIVTRQIMSNKKTNFTNKKQPQKRKKQT